MNSSLYNHYIIIILLLVVIAMLYSYHHGKNVENFQMATKTTTD